MGGVQQFTVRSGQPEQTVDFGAGGGTVSVVGGTVFYRDEPGVTATSADGSIVDGASATLFGTQFFSTSASRVDGQVRLADVVEGSGDLTKRGGGMFVMATFRSTSEALWLLTSEDGASFAQVPGPVYQNTGGTGTVASGTAVAPGTGTVRDPSVIRYKDRWWVCHTEVSFGQGTSFVVVAGDDLRSLSRVAVVDCSAVAPALASTWAPEWFVDDDGPHVLVSVGAQAAGNFQLYETHPTNAAMTTWSTPTIMAAALRSNMLDPAVVKIGSTYHLFYKDETTKYIERATASSLLGTYTRVGSTDWAGWGANLEGPQLVQIDATTWRIYFDSYLAPQQLYYSDSSDGLVTWSAKLPVKADAIQPRHGTVLRTNEDVACRQLLSLPGGPITVPYARVRRTTTVALTSAVLALPTYDSIEVNDDGMFDTAAPGYFTVRAPGIYVWSAGIAINSIAAVSGPATLYATLQKVQFSPSQTRSKASLQVPLITDGATATFVSLSSGPVRMAAGDKMQLSVKQTNAGAVVVGMNGNAEDSCVLSAVWVAA